MLKFLKHPLTRSLDLNDPRTTVQRKRIIREKRFLRKIYEDWYEWIASSLPEGESPVLELGSGAGFLNEYVSNLLTSEIFYCPFVRMVLDGCSLPFRDASLEAIVMIDVFHHISDPRTLMKEMIRCVKPGGKVLMVEPWVTLWSRWVYTRIHHEPFDAETNHWTFPVTGPLSGANSALPWIIFERDRMIFEAEFPELRVETITAEKPFMYLLSGGVSLRSLMPGFTYRLWSMAEALLTPFNKSLGMFAKISIYRI